MTISGKFLKVFNRSPITLKKIKIEQLPYLEVLLSDWLKLIVLLATSNRITLFHKRVITFYSKLFTHLASYDKEPWRA